MCKKQYIFIWLNSIIFKIRHINLYINNDFINVNEAINKIFLLSLKLMYYLINSKYHLKVLFQKFYPGMDSTYNDQELQHK